jgi:site-specific DNA recombinase
LVEFHYYTCQTYLKKGKDACNGKLVNKNKLETAVLSQIEKHVLSPRNVQRYIDLAVTQARAADSVLSPGETANKLALEDAQTRLRRWENALERGLLSIEDAARRIKEVRSEIDALVKNQGRLDQQRQIKSKVVPIPTELMNTYVQTMQARLKAKNVGHKREFLRELLREVKIEGDKITLSYRLPLEIESPPSSGREPKKKFFTVCQLVEAGGIEPPSESD